MKKTVFIAVLASFFIFSCEEVPPYIDFTVPVKSKDTTYVVSAVPAAQHKAVLIEDITGVRCNNCPDAAKTAKNIQDAKTNDSVVVMALYSIDYNSNFTSPWPGFKDLNSPFSSQIISLLGIPQGLPSGYVDRHKFGSQTTRFNPYTLWSSYTNQRLKETTPVNIQLNKSLAGRKLTINVKLAYTSAVSGNHKWAIYITESGIVSKQTTLTSYDDNYVHNHVLRASVGNAVGSVLTAPLIAGRIFEKELEYEVPADFNIDNCHLICVVTDAGTEAVVNVREIDLH